MQKLGNGGEALLAGKHARARDVDGGAFTNLFRRIVGQNGKERVDGLHGAEHGQSFDSPKARLQIRIARIAQQRGQYGGGLDAAIAESAESPERKIAAGGIVTAFDDAFWNGLR